ncbi:hypothetical protein F4801DRAFT_70647 [Xylaria longipes]|nr:hypothetical protein F4801DRAFT_70647 [Xylaria longipes]RYC59165.1 hypothetical protein CHU98_g7048 [Xylaria longipes]
MGDQNYSAPAADLTHPDATLTLVDVAASVSPNALSSNTPEPRHDRDSAITTSGLTFVDLPLEIREIIWRFALPEPRVLNVLVWVSAGLKMQLLNRSDLKMTLAHVCFEARRIVKESGYVLAFRDEDEPNDPGVWFHPRIDRIERTIWGPGDWNMGA